MDELAFQRRTLANACRDLAEALDKAGDSYNPEDVLPTSDIVVVVMIDPLHTHVVNYSRALASHAAGTSDNPELKAKLEKVLGGADEEGLSRDPRSRVEGYLRRTSGT